MLGFHWVMSIYILLHCFPDILLMDHLELLAMIIKRLQALKF